MESKDLFILLIVAGLAILLYAYWHFVGSKKEIRDDDKKDNVDSAPKCDADFCPINSY